MEHEILWGLGQREKIHFSGLVNQMFDLGLVELGE